MTYANPEQPVLRTPSFRPTPCPRADRKVLTRFAADSVNEIVMSSILPADSQGTLVRGAMSYNHCASPTRKTSCQRVFHRQQTAQLLSRNVDRLRPAGRISRNPLIPPPTRKLTDEPLGHLQSMGASVRLKTCGLHNVVRHGEMEAHPGFLPRTAGLASHAQPPLRRRFLLRCWRKCPQTGDLPPHSLGGEIDVSGRGSATNGKAQRALRQLGIAP